MFRASDGIGHCGQDVPGPPWILGHRGAPREAPENTVVSLRRALERGLDGFAYELRACASGDLLLHADENLERTSDGHGPLRERTLPELFGLDAGGWFGRLFLGEPFGFFDEALAIEGRTGDHPQHWALLAEPGLLAEATRVVHGVGRRRSVRLASVRRETCRDLRDAGFEAAWVRPRAGEEERRISRDEGFAAFAAPGASWVHGGLLDAEWRSERWALEVDDPSELLTLCRARVNGLTTTEPRRALAVRALVFLTPDGGGEYPLQVEPLAVDGRSALGSVGEWCGRWDVRALVRNPFAFRTRVELSLEVRRGAFESEGLPPAFDLEPGADARVSFQVTGGSWSPGGDPLLVASFSWEAGPGRAPERLSLDTPLSRVRSCRVSERTTRLELLRERPNDPPLSVTIARRGRTLLIALENPGPLQEPSTLVHLDGQNVIAGRGVRLPLPSDWDQRADGVPFSVAIAGRVDGRMRYRRWAGGLPDGLDAGAPGRLLPGR